MYENGIFDPMAGKIQMQGTGKIHAVFIVSENEIFSIAGFLHPVNNCWSYSTTGKDESFLAPENDRERSVSKICVKHYKNAYK